MVDSMWVRMGSFMGSLVSSGVVIIVCIIQLWFIALILGWVHLKDRGDLQMIEAVYSCIIVSLVTLIIACTSKELSVIWIMITHQFFQGPYSVPITKTLPQLVYFTPMVDF